MRITEPRIQRRIAGVLSLAAFFLGSGFAQEEIFTGEAGPAREPPKTSAGRKLPVRFGGDVAFVGPYVWRGIRISQGSMLQPAVRASYQSLTASVFLSMYGSKKDLRYGGRDENKRPVPLEGPGSQSPFEVNEMKIHLDWSHAFSDLIHLAGRYTHLAYAANKDAMGEFEAYGWFNKKSSYGEVTLMPSLQMGPFNLFTQRNLVVFSGKWVRVEEKWDDVNYIFYDDTTEVRNNLWDYQYSYGLTFEKKTSDQFTVELTLQEHYANERFLSKWIRDLDTKEPIETQGFYATVFYMATRFEPGAGFTISVNAGAEVVTNEEVSNNLINNTQEIRGAFMFGGVKTSYSW